MTSEHCCAACDCPNVAAAPRSVGHRPSPALGAGRSVDGPCSARSRRPGTLGCNPARRGRFPFGQDLRGLGPRTLPHPRSHPVALRTLEWVGRRENLVVCGPSGTGKTMFLEALGQSAVETGRPGPGSASKTWAYSSAATEPTTREPGHRPHPGRRARRSRDIGLFPVARRRRRPLPPRRRRLRTTLRGHQLEPPPVGFDELMPKTLAQSPLTGSCTMLMFASRPRTVVRLANRPRPAKTSAHYLGPRATSHLKGVSRRAN